MEETFQVYDEGQKHFFMVPSLLFRIGLTSKEIYIYLFLSYKLQADSTSLDAVKFECALPSDEVDKVIDSLCYINPKLGMALISKHNGKLLLHDVYQFIGRI